MAVQSNVELIDFDLADCRHRRAQVVLQGEARDAEKDIDQAVVTNLCEQRLFVAQGIGRDDFRPCIGNLDRNQISSRLMRASIS